MKIIIENVDLMSKEEVQTLKDMLVLNNIKFAEVD